MKSHVALRLLFAFAFTAGWLHAVPYFGEKFTYRQPDGESFEVHLYGDEFFAYQETEDGYLVIHDPKNGFFCYAKVSPDGNLVSTGVRVGRAKPAGLKRKQRLAPGMAMVTSLGNRNLLGVDDKGQRNKGRKLVPGKGREILNVPVGEVGPQPEAGSGDEPGGMTDPDPQPSPPSSVTINKRVGLVLLASFPDRPGDVTKTVADIDAYCNADVYVSNGNATSIKGYFKIQSNGKLEYSNNVTAWFTAAHNRDYYTNPSVSYTSRTTELIREGLAALAARGFDFSQCDGNNDGKLDGVNIFYAGTRTNAWSQGLWPHQSSSSWSGLAGSGLSTNSFEYQITDMPSNLTIGTFCHENGHMICDFPDLYAYASNGVTNAANLGGFSLMASSGSTHPRHVDPYLKIHAGWADVVDITSSSQQLCAVQQDRNFFYRYRNPTRSQEYFLFEVRGNSGYEGPWGGAGSTNPANGLVVYHALQTGSNTRSTIFSEESVDTNGRVYPRFNYTTPYELMVVEANPSTTVTPWYDDPTPGSNDAFTASGKSSISDITSPDLKFWASNGRTVASGANINMIGASGATMTFKVGSDPLPTSPVTAITTTQMAPKVDFGQNAASQSFAVFNSAGGTLSYDITDNVEWLSCSPASGSATTGANAIIVTFSTSALAVGNHTATITVNGGGAGTKTIPVSLTVNAQPIIDVSPGSISVAGISGSPGPAVSFNVQNTGGGTAAYTITKTQPWLSLARTSGTVSAELDLATASLDATGLSPGIYNDIITVTAPSASNSPVAIPVTFTVEGEDMILIAPNGGERWVRGTSETISWSSGLGGTVKIELFNDGVLFSTIATGAPNTGSYVWSIPSAQWFGSKYRIRVSSVEAPAELDQSSSDFSISAPPIYYASMDADPSWSLQGAWAWGQPTGVGGDPSSGFNDTNVIGYNLNGVYADNLAETHATTPVIDCSNRTNVRLSFYRWLGIESGNYDKAYIRVSRNGTDWTTIFSHNTSESGTLQESVWSLQTYDISAIADNQPVVFIRFTMGQTDSNITYSGWNIDEVVVDGDAPATYPEIVVEQPVNTSLTDGSGNIGCGSANVGSSTAPITFTIRNTGSENLTDLVVSKDGANNSDFMVGTLGASTLAPGASTTFSVTFSPGAAGSRSAAIQIASNDADENPFDINLTGSGVGPGTLAVFPEGGLATTGTYGGVFSPSALEYTLSNPGNTPVNWTASKTEDWVLLDSTGGTLAPGATTTVTATINAGTLNVGGYGDTVTFSNTTNGSGSASRPMDLTVNPILATVSLTNLLQTYDGQPKEVTVTTTPSPLAHEVMYNGSPTEPTHAGSYAVVATITEPNHSGSASGNLIIAYTINYLGNGNTNGTLPAAQTKLLDTALPLATNSGNLTKTGYTFAGWNTAADGSGTDYATGALYTDNASLTLHAKWVPGADGTWIQATAGSFDWGTEENWSGGIAASGADRTAYFTPNLTANQVVNLESDRTIGNITFTDSTSASHDLTVSGAKILNLVRTSGTPTVNVTNRTLTVNSEVAGGNGLMKSGAGTLAFGGINTYSGGTTVSAGTLAITSDGNLGASNGDILFDGNASLNINASGFVMGAGRTITVNNGVTATFISNNNGKTFQGVLEGSGELIASSTTSFSFTNPANTFSGDFSSRTGGSTGYGLDLASIGDGVGAGLIKLGNGGTGGTLRWMKASGGSTILANRQIALSGTTGTGTIAALGGSSAENLIINKDLLVSGTGNKKLLLAGTNTGANTFAGNITDASGSVITVEKTEAGTWALRGMNSYGGITNLVASATTGRLVFQGAQSLSPNTKLVFAQNSSNVQSVRFLDDGVGTINFNRPIEFGGSNTTQNLNIFVGNNNTANLGSSSGTNTGSTIQAGNITFTSVAVDTNTTTLNATGANGYRLQTGIITLNNLVNRTAGSTTATALNPTSANLTVAAVAMASGNQGSGVDGVPILRLSGTSSDNHVTGAISNAPDHLAGQALGLEKSGTSTWTLTGTNTFSGLTTISGGTLQLGDGTSGKDGTIDYTSGITNNAALVFNRFGDVSSGVPISGLGAVIKTGPGSQTLSGTNSYAGTTTVSAGKLFINGNLSNTAAALTVESGATLGGTGTVGRNVSIGDGGKLEFDISTAAASHDALDISSGRDFAFSGASELTITSSGGAMPGVYTLITGGNSMSGVAPATVNLPSGWTATVSISGNRLSLDLVSTGGPGPVDHFSISPILSTQTVGTAITGITVTAQDSSNATATGFTGTVTFGGTGGFSGTSASFTAGVLGNVSQTPTVAGSNLTLTVDDGAGHAGSSAIATIQSVYDGWSGNEGFTIDSNNDGIPNGLAWALGATGPAANAAGILPITDNATDPDFLIYTFRRSDTANAASSIACQYDSDLGGDWTTAVHDAANVIITVSDNFHGSSPGIDKVEVKIRRNQATGGRLFTRLRVIPSP